MKILLITLAALMASCDSGPTDAAHSQNPELQACLGTSGYADVPGRKKENQAIELQCRQLIELRKKQH